MAFAFPAAADFRITILHTNDLHAQFEPRRNSRSCTPEENAGGLCYGGAARLFTAIETLRERAGPTILLDGGDVFRGTGFSECFKGAFAAEIMNEIGYDAMVPGNHDFDYGMGKFIGFLEATDFPLVAANIDTSRIARMDDLLPKSIVIERGGQKLAIIGVTLPDMYERSDTGTDVTFTDPTSAVQREVDRLTAQGVDKVIVLSHLGYNSDKRLAKATEGVDVIVGGHSHILLSNNVEDATGPYPTMVGNVAIVQNHPYGKYLGALEVTFDDQGVVTAAKGEPVPLDSRVHEDQGMVARVVAAGDVVGAYFEQVIGRSNALLDGDGHSCRQGECTMGNLIADAMLDRFRDRGAEIAIYPAGSIYRSIEAGDVTREQVRAVMDLRYSMSRFQATGAEVIEAIEHGVSAVEQGSGRFPQVAGLKFTYDPDAPPGARVSDVFVRENGVFVPIVKKKTYGLVSSSTLRTGGAGYDMFLDRDYAYDYWPIIYEVVVEYLAKNNPYVPYLDGRITSN